MSVLFALFENIIICRVVWYAFWFFASVGQLGVRNAFQNSIYYFLYCNKKCVACSHVEMDDYRIRVFKTTLKLIDYT